MKNFIIILMTSILFSCQTKSENTAYTNPLLQTLQSVKADGILFGHQDDLAYGMNWQYIDGESDVKRVSGDYPAVFGWELGGLERGDAVNLDSVPFDKMKEFAIQVNQMGGINTFSWHPYSLVDGKNSWSLDTIVVKHIIPNGSLHKEFTEQLDKIADFLLQLKDTDGLPIPIIFRPWHEMGGSWFWWGNSLCTPDEYIQLFRYTIQYLEEEKGLNNMLVCYSPNGGYQNAEGYLTWYPGDDIIDMLGLDEYEWSGAVNWVENTQKYLNIMIQLAREKNKLAAFAETGHENLVDSLWFTNKLGQVLAPDSIASELSYVLVWRNDPDIHHFFSYEGHPSEQDAKEFLSQANIWLLNDFNENKY